MDQKVYGPQSIVYPAHLRLRLKRSSIIISNLVARKSALSSLIDHSFNIIQKAARFNFLLSLLRILNKKWNLLSSEDDNGYVPLNQHIFFSLEDKN